MHPLTRGTEAYRQTEACSRSPLELVVMLYSGALRFVTEAIEANAAGQLGRRGTSISRALAILGELQSTLNVAQGGTVAFELDRLYGYMQERLLDVTTNEDARGLREVQKLLAVLRESWVQLAKPAAAQAS